MKNIVYKIRNKKTGQYSRGGHAYEDLNFDDTGKSWKNIGHVKNHLNMYDNRRTTHWEVVTFNLVEVEKCEIKDLLKLNLDLSRIR